MKNKININILFLFCIIYMQKPCVAQVLPSSCTNLDFMSGDFTNWQGYISDYNSMPSKILGIVPGRHTIITNSVPDPYTCNNVMTLPPGANVCARIGNGGINPTAGNPPAWTDGVQCQIDFLTYNITVSPASTLLTYKYAVVLQDPNTSTGGHPPPVRPRFGVNILDINGNSIDPSCSKLDVTVDSTVVGFRSCYQPDLTNAGANPYSSDGVIYRDWTTVGVDLRNYVGQTITLQFETWDCGYCGHFGYAYITARCDSFGLVNQGCQTNGGVKVSAPEGFSYNWFPNNETTKDVFFLNPQIGDSVAVELTAVTGCKTSLWTKLYPIYLTPTFTINSDTVCLNSPNQFTDLTNQLINSFDSKDTSFVPIINWDWKFGDGQTSTSSSPQHTYTSVGQYTVTLIVKNQSGCSDSIKKIITVLPLPKANFTVKEVCVKSVASFTNNSSVTGFQAIINNAWIFSNNNITSSIQNPSQTYTLAGSYTASLIVTTNYGCSDDTAVTVKIWSLPKSIFIADNVCLGSTTQFTNSSISFDAMDNLTGYIWDYGDGSPFNSLLAAPHQFISSGSFSVHLTATTAKGCVSDTLMSVNVFAVPSASFLANPLCLNSPTNFQATATSTIGITNWEWNFSDNNNNTATGQNAQHTYTLPSLYTPTLTITSVNGCSVSIINPLSIVPLPFVYFKANKYNGCSPLCANFLDLSYSSFDSIKKWNWNLGDGSNASISNPAHCYTSSGIYTVSLMVETSNQCVASYTWNSMMEVFPQPTANFEPNPFETTITAPEINFQNLSINANQWQWNFGDNSVFSYIESPTHPYSNAGEYTVWLVVKSLNNCLDTISKTVIIKPDWTLYVPNAFSPLASPGINDGFRAVALNIKKYEIWIYDRWGETIFYADDIEKAWNGFKNNEKEIDKAAKQDVYVWKILFKDNNDKLHERVGHVTLLR